MNFTEEELREAAALVREAMLDALPAPEECEEHVFSPAFERKMEALRRRQRRPKVYRFLRRAAAVLLAVLVGSGAWVALNVPAEAGFLDWIKELYETHIVYRFRSEPTELKTYRPAWVPDGYEETAAFDSAVYYQNQEGITLSFSYAPMQSGATSFLMPEEMEEQDAKINKLHGDFYLSSDPEISNNLIWTDTSVEMSFSISGYLDKSNMVKMAESIYLVDSKEN